MQFSVSILSVRYTKYIYHKITESTFSTMKTQKLKEFGSSKISKVQNFLDQTIFKRGCCQKNDTFFKIFIWDAKFSHLLQNLELALKFQISDKKANLSD